MTVSLKAVPAVGVPGVERVKRLAVAAPLTVKLVEVPLNVPWVAVSAAPLGVIEGDRRRADASGEGHRGGLGRGLGVLGVGRAAEGHRLRAGVVGVGVAVGVEGGEPSVEGGARCLGPRGGHAEGVGGDWTHGEGDRDARDRPLGDREPRRSGPCSRRLRPFRAGREGDRGRLGRGGVVGGGARAAAGEGLGPAVARRRVAVGVEGGEAP